MVVVPANRYRWPLLVALLTGVVAAVVTTDRFDESSSMTSLPDTTANERSVESRQSSPVSTVPIPRALSAAADRLQGSPGDEAEPRIIGRPQRAEFPDGPVPNTTGEPRVIGQPLPIDSAFEAEGRAGETRFIGSFIPAEPSDDNEAMLDAALQPCFLGAPLPMEIWEAGQATAVSESTMIGTFQQAEPTFD